ncbi:MAG: class II fructose-bisphosphate aldolase [Nanoarchaeota archaeon]|nr:class II fructose-bisphosphate aldolase [Nanoarchaeota archaeon]
MNYLEIRKRYNQASTEGYAIGAFNFSTVELANAIFLAAVKLKSPVLMCTSSGEMEHVGPEVARGIVNGLNRVHPDVAILHLDHGKKFEHIVAAIDAGYDSVHCDGSALPYKENVRLTKKCVQYAHKHGKWIEGELGHVGGSSTLHKDQSYSDVEMIMTEPDEARRFVQETGVNSLAINIGNVHGVWNGIPHIDFKRLKEIQKATRIPLVLHGGSGIPMGQIKKALSFGIDKININTEIRVAYSESIRNSLKDKNMFIPTSYMPLAVKAVQKVVETKIKMFGSTNKLRKL